MLLNPSTCVIQSNIMRKPQIKNAWWEAFTAEHVRWTGVLESNAVSTVKCNLRCFCIYLYVQIQRIHCKNIYINIYPVQSTFISFFLESIWLYWKKEKIQYFVGKSQLTSQREQGLLQNFHRQLPLFHVNVTVYTRMFAFLRLVLPLFFISSQNK